MERDFVTRLRDAFLPALFALGAGALAYAAAGTLMVLVTPGLGVDSVAALVIGPPLILIEGLYWGLIGGALFVFPVALLLFSRWRHNTLGTRLALSAALFAPVYLAGFRGRILDGLILAVAIWVGVRAGLRRLDLQAGTP